MSLDRNNSVKEKGTEIESDRYKTQQVVNDIHERTNDSQKKQRLTLDYVEDGISNGSQKCMKSNEKKISKEK